MSRVRSMVESKPFSRNEAMQMLTTKDFKGDTSNNAVESTISTVGPQQSQQSDFRGLCMAKYWQTFDITTKSSVKVKM